MDLDEAPIIHGLELPSRCICAQSAETNITRFLVGTQSLRQENQIHYIEFDDENNVIDKTVFSHPFGEIWHLSANYNDSQLFTSCYQSYDDAKLSLSCIVGRLSLDEDMKPNLTVPDGTNTNAAAKLEKILSIEVEDNATKLTAHWKPIEGENDLMVLSNTKMNLYDVERSSAALSSSFDLPLRKGHLCPITNGRWNPHHSGKVFAVATEQSVLGWDVRSNQKAFFIENAHGQLVRDIDFNPNKMYYVVTCGDDCQVRFWDTRNFEEPVQVLVDDHSHWVWSARFNPFHDQLVLSGGSDSKVILYNMKAISSEPYDQEVSSDGEYSDSSKSDDDEYVAEKSEMKDGVIGVYEEHEDSVYALEWSAADPWTFASLSYDGRFIINRVPKTIYVDLLLAEIGMQSDIVEKAFKTAEMGISNFLMYPAEGAKGSQDNSSIPPSIGAPKDEPVQKRISNVGDNEDFLSSKPKFKVYSVRKKTRRLHSCVECGELFANAYALKHHNLKTHNEKRTLPCLECGRRFDTTVELKDHLQTHSSRQKHTCTVCREGFSEYRHLAEHLKIHYAKKQFLCAVCGSEFAYECNLKRHELLHIQQPGRPQDTADGADDDNAKEQPDEQITDEETKRPKDVGKDP